MSEFINEIIAREAQREANTLELIASENFPSDAVLAANGSCLTNKYAEGYPSRDSINRFIERFPDYEHTGNVGRYYGGCDEVDMAELYARYMFKKAFHTDYHVNVQPHSGSNANLGVYVALLQPGDTILSMDLNHGGHLTHGAAVNLSGRLHNIVAYGVDERGYIDMEDVRKQALECKPKLILAGASAYPRQIDFAAFAEIAHEVGAYFMVDMAHIAGLIAAGEHPSPFGLADVVTTTTHKTLRGTRGGMIFCKPELAKKIDSAIFPGIQGGPLMHVIAGKAVAAEEACTDAYRDYIRQVVKNAKAMSETFVELGFELTTGGTDTHMLLIDFTHTHPELTGREAQDLLQKNGITLNKNCVPTEKRSPMQTSGVRIGTPAETTRGLKEEDFRNIARKIDELLRPYKATK